MSTIITPRSLKEASVRLPSSAKLIDALHNALKQPDVDINQVVKLMTSDVAISTRLFRMANTASATRGETVTSIDQALAWLGIAAAYRATCATVSARLCEQNLPLYGISAERLFLNSIAMAVGMEILATQADLDPKSGYTIGLLHNLGRILIQRVALHHEIPAGSADLPDIHAVILWERETFGCTHAEAGAMLLSLWGLNPIFGAVIAHQHDLDRVGRPEIRRWSAMLHLTAALVAGTDFGLGVVSDAWPISDTTFAEAGLPSMDIIKLSGDISEATRDLCHQCGLSLPAHPSTSYGGLG